MKRRRHVIVLICSVIIAVWLGLAWLDSMGNRVIAIVQIDAEHSITLSSYTHHWWQPTSGWAGRIWEHTITYRSPQGVMRHGVAENDEYSFFEEVRVSQDRKRAWVQDGSGPIAAWDLNTNRIGDNYTTEIVPVWASKTGGIQIWHNSNR